MTLEWIDIFRSGAFVFGTIGIILGLTALVFRNYKKGETNVPLMLNAPLMMASFCRGMVLLLNGEILLASLDAYGFCLSAILVMQNFGFCLQQKTAPA